MEKDVHCDDNGTSIIKQRNDYMLTHPVLRIWHYYVIPFLIRHYKAPVTENELYRPLPNTLDSRKQFEKLHQNWEKEVASSKSISPSLLRVVIRTYWTSYIKNSCILLIGQICNISKAVILVEVLEHFKDGSVSTTYAYIYTCILAIISLLSLLAINNSSLLNTILLAQVRTACSGLVYNKLLTLRIADLQKTSIGHITNLVSNDIGRLESMVRLFGYLIVSPIINIIIACLLVHMLGGAGGIAVLLLVLIKPIQIYIGKLFAKLRSVAAKLTDKRISCMSEIVNGITIIKMNIWEEIYASFIRKARNYEMKQISKIWYLRSFYNTSSRSYKIVVGVGAFVCYSAFGGQLDPAVVFMSLYLLDQANCLSNRFSIILRNVSEVFISFDRIRNFLILSDENLLQVKCINDDRLCNHQEQSSVYDVVSKPGVSVSNLTVGWLATGSTIENISVSTQPTELLVIVGSVGSGKSTLLQAILGEIPIMNGSVTLSGKIGYVPQSPWVYNGTLRDNITFGSDYEKDWYNRVLEMCELKTDIEMMADGDSTIVGEKGMALSGGQKARTSLCRAIYSRADIYLLDDPFSSLDSKVGRAVFEKCIIGYLSKFSTIVLVSNNSMHLQHADHILVLEGGKVKVLGNLMAVKPVTDDLFRLPLTEESDDNKNVTLDDVFDTFYQEHTLGEGDNVPKQENEMAKDPVEKGAIQKSVYLSYLRAGMSPFIAFGLIIFTLVSHASHPFADYWLAQWSKEDSKNATHQSSQEIPTIFGLLTWKLVVTIYFGIVIFNWITTAFSVGLGYAGFLKASHKLHNVILMKVIRAPIKFFNFTPIGQILNRFAKDTGVMDDSLGDLLTDLLHTSLRILIVIILSVLVNPWIFIPTIPLIVALWCIRGITLKPMRDVKRIEGVLRNPIFDHISQTLGGLPIIRSYRVENFYRDKYFHYLNKHNEAWFMIQPMKMFLMINLNIICVLFALFTYALSIYIADSLIDSNVVYLCLSYVLSLTTAVEFAVMLSTEVEVMMTSVERVMQYSRLDEEAYMRNDYVIPPNNWPQKGVISLHNLSLSYDKRQQVLNNINLEIVDGEKLAFIGRTGAGKTSIFTALLRLADYEGIIEIDGVDINKIPLRSLRSTVAVVPQGAVLFAGTLRDNIDPFNEHPDSEIWNVLEAVQLKEEIISRNFDVNSQNFSKSVANTCDLNIEVSSRGSNFSCGQQQLICLARAILRKCKIILIDEATASVDLQTQHVIQEVLNKKLNHSTVVTIAHRLETVSDSDRLAVIAKGTIVEIGSPNELLDKTDGYYSKIMSSLKKQ